MKNWYYQTNIILIIKLEFCFNKVNNVDNINFDLLMHSILIKRPEKEYFTEIKY